MASTIREKIFDFVYILSMREAVRQKSFSGEKGWLYDFSDSNMIKARGWVKDYIDRILFGVPFSDQEEHEGFFLETAIKICDSINDSIKKPNQEPSKFTFGNSQKLINMVVKHFYIIYYYCENVRRKFIYCHCPMDSQMLKKVWKKYKSHESPKTLTGCTRKEFIKPWSQEDFDHDPSGKEIIPQRYSKFQKYIREVCESEVMIPIEYDYEMWGNENM